MTKPVLPQENSVALRIVCCLMAIIAVTASFIFGESSVPVIEFSLIQMAMIFLCIWLCIGGGIFSYRYRVSPPPIISKLIKFGALLIVINLAHELWEDNLYAMQFQFLRPLMHALVAASVLTSFELRTRNDIISSATFGLLLLSVAATSGKSVLFGIFVFLYICLGAALLMLSCQSQTRNESASTPRPTMVKQTTRGSNGLAIMATLLLLPVASVAAFCVMPRMDNQADSASAQVRAMTTSAIYAARKSNETDRPMKSLRPVGPNRIKAAQRREQARQAKELAPPQQPLEQTKQPAPKAPAKTQTVPKQPHVNAPAPKGSEPSGSRWKGPAIPGSGARRPKEQAGTEQSTRKPTTTQAAGNEPAPKPPAGKGRSAKEPATNEPATKAPATKQPAAKKPDTKERNSSKGAPAATKKSTGTKEAAVATPEAAIKIMDENSLTVNKGITDPEEPLFTLACTRSVYTKFLVLDYFDGREWTRKTEGDSWVFTPTEKGTTLDCPPLTISLAMPIMELAQQFKVERNLGFCVPFAGIPQQLSLMQPVWVDSFGNVRASDPLLKGTEYSVIAQLPVYSLKAMRCEAPPSEALDNESDGYLQIPDNQSQQLFQLSSDIAGTDGNRFTRAERLLLHLRKNYAYTLKPMKAAPDANLVDTFLFDARKGDCTAFASSFVMLCRAAEIPARCVTGYLPGDFDPLTGATHVKQKHGHAWAEAYIPPYGWVPFDATPNGMLPARPEENYYNYERIKREIESCRTKAHSTTAIVIESVLWWSGKLIALAGLAVSLFALYLGARATSSLVFKAVQAARKRHPATRMKDGLLKRLRKVGVVRTPADTGHDIVTKLQQALHEQDRDEILALRLSAFVETYNAVYFGQQDRMQELRSLDRDIKKLLSEISKRR